MPYGTEMRVLESSHTSMRRTTDHFRQNATANFILMFNRVPKSFIYETLAILSCQYCIFNFVTK